VKSERTTTQQTLANQAAQLSALQTQLSSAKAAYETETKLLATLRERQTTQNAEIQKVKEELIHAESDLSAVRVDKAEVEGAFLRDKEEARELHRKMVGVSTQVEQLKADVEKAKKEAKQQKGLLAIARKQLSAKESEKAKVTMELEVVNAELAEATKETDVVEAELAKDVQSSAGAPIVPDTLQHVNSMDSLTRAASHVLPTSPDPSTPSGNTSSNAGKSNNPFERLQRSESSVSRSSSPFRPSDVADPFGFSSPLEAEEVVTPSKSAGEGTATGQLDAVIPPSNREKPKSPDSTTGSENFATPKETATGPSQSPVDMDAASQFSALEGSYVSKFPALEGMPELPGQHPNEMNDHEHTDIGAQLKELDVIESDSDSDEEDSKPLADLIGSKGPPAAVANGSASAPSAFDDAFGAMVDVPSANPSSTPVTDALSSRAVTSSPSAPPVKPLAGVDAFDEAMGKISPTRASPIAPQFTVDSAFDDNFDFASVSQPTETQTNITFPPVPSVVNGKSPITPKANGFEGITSASNQNGTPVTSTVQEQKPLSFDDAFESSEQSSAPPVHANQANHGISFGEAFSGDPGKALQLSNPVITTISAPQTSPPQPFPPSSPAIAKVDSPVADTRPASPPPRAKSPTTPRVSSPTPRPRPSTSSSKDSDKPKEPTTRHSKLSVSYIARLWYI
jgi:epidermal growth factor receptor substrate 15